MLLTCMPRSLHGSLAGLRWKKYVEWESRKVWEGPNFVQTYFRLVCRVGLIKTVLGDE